MHYIVYFWSSLLGQKNSYINFFVLAPFSLGVRSVNTPVYLL